MLFNSITFLFFFSLVYLVYWGSPKSYRSMIVLVASALFYGIFSWVFLGHFLLVISINYILYKKLGNTGHKKWMLTAVIFNATNLGIFKYFYFFNQFLWDLTGFPFFEEFPRLVQIALPMAISFYTFQMIAWVVDQYKNKSEPLVTALEYFSFVLFFPVLIAGPIMRKGDFFPRIEKEANKDQLYRACYLMMLGLVKKILVADPITSMIAPIYQNPGQFDSFSIFLGGVAYAIQVYCDFSGLTDMARSVGLFLGYELPENFKAPFFATSMSDLWKRWHITLSMWLRDYIFIPLGGSRVAEGRIYFNLILTMTIGGIWHGADYTFIAWGFYLGFLLCLERFLQVGLKLNLVPEKNKVLIVLKVLVVFVLFAMSGIMFRSNNASLMVDSIIGLFTNGSDSLTLLMQAQNLNWLVQGSLLVSGGNLFSLDEFSNSEKLGYLLVALVLFQVIQYKPEILNRFRQYDAFLVVVFGVLTIFLIATLSQDGGEFIYFKF